MGIESSVRKPAASKSQSSAKPAASLIPAVQKSAASLAAAAGLPSNKLSASIVSFARFFSLPLKPELLADIRRQALAPQLPAQTTQTANPAALSDSAPALKSFADVKTREVFSLAAAAAESKGTELTAKGLESYAEAFAEAVDPDLQRRRKNDDEQRKRRDKDQNEHTNVITAGGIKKMALENAEKNPVLDILNKLPGKNGQRWIVLPFDFCEGDREYFVSMRILTEESHTKAQRNNSQSCCYLTLDVLMKKDNEEDRRLFIFESANEKIVRVSVCVWQEISSKNQNHLKKEISEIFNIPLERVNFRTSEDAFPFEAEFGGTSTSVDEAV